MSGQRLEPTELRAVVLAGLVATLGLWAALAGVRYLPTHDGPHHVYLAHLQNHFSDPGAPYPEYYVPSRALSALGFSLLFAPLSDVMAWRPALLVTEGVIVAAWAWGVTLLCASLNPRRILLGAVGFATAFQWALYMGFFSYLLSSAVGFFSLSLAIAVREWRPKHRVAIAALLFLQALFHVFAAQVVGLVLLLLVLFRAPRAAWLRELLLLVAMGLPTLYVAAYAAGLIGAESTTMPSYFESAYYLPLRTRVGLLAAGFASGPGWRAWPVVLLALGGLGLGAWRLRVGQARAEEKALLCAATLLLAAALLLPFSMQKWEFLSPRFIPMALTLGIVLLPLERLRRRGPRVAVALGLGLFGFASIGWAAQHHRRLERACSGALAGIDAKLERKGPRLPIVLDPLCTRLAAEPPFEVAYAEPAWNVGLLYAVQQGGIVPYAFTGVPQLHSFVMTRDGDARIPEIPQRIQTWGTLARPGVDEALRAALLTELAAAGAQYEDVIFYGPEADRSQIAARGFATDLSDGPLWIGHFEGCPAEVEVELDLALDEPLVVELGWHPSEAAVHRAVLRPQASGQWQSTVMRPKRRFGGGLRVGQASGGTRLSLSWRDAPCGAVWIRAALLGAGPEWKRDGPLCRGADAEGRLVRELSSNERKLRCSLSP